MARLVLLSNVRHRASSADVSRVGMLVISHKGRSIKVYRLRGSSLKVGQLLVFAWLVPESRAIIGICVVGP